MECCLELGRAEVPLLTLASALGSFKSKEEQNFLCCTVCAHPLKHSQEHSHKLEMPKEMIWMLSMIQLKFHSKLWMDDIPN